MDMRAHTQHIPFLALLALTPVPLRGEFRSGFLSGQKLHPTGESGYIHPIRPYKLFGILSYSSYYRRGNRFSQPLHEINLSASVIMISTKCIVNESHFLALCEKNRPFLLAFGVFGLYITVVTLNPGSVGQCGIQGEQAASLSRLPSASVLT